MSYTNATFFMDYEGGSDTARADLVPTAYANNGAGLVRVTCNSTAAYATGAVFDVAGTTGSVYVGGWIVTIIDGTHVDLQGSTFTVNPAAKGTLTPRGGSQKSDAWKTITSGATAARLQAGDTTRVMASPDQTSLGINGTWTDGPLPATVVPVSSTNATPIVMTLSAGHGIVTNDTVIVNSHATNTKANGVWKASVSGNALTLLNADGTNSVGNGVGGATGTVRKFTNGVVTLASAITKAIACVGNQGTLTNWTPSANVTCAVITTDFREGGECQQIAIGTSFVTGLAAFVATGTIDLSTYQQVTFAIKQTAGTVLVASDARLELSTNATGTAVVHNIAIPALVALNQWVYITVDLATNMNAAIQSIGWDQLVDRGAQTFLLDCVTACKASSNAASLTLTSLIGKNTAGETFYGVQSINDVRVVIAGGQADRPAGAPQRGYSGTTETVTTYKRETIKTAMAATPSSTQVQVLQKSGTAGSLVSYEGGWDRTNMTSQSGETWFDGQSCGGYGIVINGVNFVSLNKIKAVRYLSNFRSDTSASSGVLNNADSNNSDSAGFDFQTSTTFDSWAIGTLIANCNAARGAGFGVGGGNFRKNTITSLTTNGNGTEGMELGSSAAFDVVANHITTFIGNNNGTTGVRFIDSSIDNVIDTATTNGNSAGSGVRAQVSQAGRVPTRNRIGTLTSQNNGAYGADLSGARDFVIGGGSSATNVTAGINPSGFGGSNYLRNFTASDSTAIATTTAYTDSRTYWEKYGGTAGDNRIFTDGGAIVSQTATRHSSTGIAWKLSPTSANRDVNYPLQMQLATFAVKANKAITLSCWVNRDNTSALVAKIIVPGGQIAGIASDVSVTASGAINTWANETLASMTPTEDGVIQVFAQAYGGTTNSAYFDDISITQA